MLPLPVPRLLPLSVFRGTMLISLPPVLRMPPLILSVFREVPLEVLLPTLFVFREATPEILLPPVLLLLPTLFRPPLWEALTLQQSRR